MRFIILILLFFSGISQASTCYVVSNVTSLSVIFEYPGPCNQAAFSGDIGNPAKTTHLIDTDFQAAVGAATTSAASAATAKQNRIQALQTACAAQTGLLAAICARLINDLN